MKLTTDEMRSLLIEMNLPRYPIKQLAEKHGVCRQWMKREIETLRRHRLICNGEMIPKRPVVGVKIGDESVVVGFKSITEAGRQGFDSNKVCACLNGRRKSHAGYEWSECDWAPTRYRSAN